MLYTTKCSMCDEVGEVGSFSPSKVPVGWLLISWNSDHSTHVESVCSIKCLNDFELDEEDLPKLHKAH
jgi:hypothetical protein